MKKGIAFYEKALTLVDIQDNSAINHIDTVTLKPGKRRNSGNSSRRWMLLAYSLKDLNSRPTRDYSPMLKD